jgi:ABC-type nickel/cobalt efflux system permease component RcnA
MEHLSPASTVLLFLLAIWIFFSVLAGIYKWVFQEDRDILKEFNKKNK